MHSRSEANEEKRSFSESAPFAEKRTGAKKALPSLLEQGLL